ncbi:MAG: hypothetical protein E7131_04525 [Rikenellaceae bacterium]|nr:hypothetical protein [Rikenellaceae bacterium]
MNKFTFAYRLKASNYVVCHLFTLHSALGFCHRSSPAAACSIVWHDIAVRLKVPRSGSSLVLGTSECRPSGEI